MNTNMPIEFGPQDENFVAQYIWPSGRIKSARQRENEKLWQEQYEKFLSILAECRDKIWAVYALDRLMESGGRYD